jgi:hypothetical protein
VEGGNIYGFFLKYSVADFENGFSQSSTEYFKKKLPQNVFFLKYSMEDFEKGFSKSSTEYFKKKGPMSVGRQYFCC